MNMNIKKITEQITEMVTFNHSGDWNKNFAAVDKLVKDIYNGGFKEGLQAGQALLSAVREDLSVEDTELTFQQEEKLSVQSVKAHVEQDHEDALFIIVERDDGEGMAHPVLRDELEGIASACLEYLKKPCPSHAQAYPRDCPESRNVKGLSVCKICGYLCK